MSFTGSTFRLRFSGSCCKVSRSDDIRDSLGAEGGRRARAPPRGSSSGSVHGTHSPAMDRSGSFLLCYHIACLGLSGGSRSTLLEPPVDPTSQKSLSRRGESHGFQ